MSTYEFQGNGIKRASFHAYVRDKKHHGMINFEIDLMDQTDSIDNLSRTQSFWLYEFDTF